MTQHPAYPNPNLTIVLHYVSKTFWLVLAGIFGVIGYNLYVLGMVYTTKASFSFLGMKFTLEDAGPGLVVMVFALACSLIGAIRSKVEFKKNGLVISAPEPQPHGPVQDKLNPSAAARECKLSRRLVAYLTKYPQNYVVLNSHGHIDLESLTWSVVSSDVQQRAVSDAAAWMRGLPRGGPMEWNGTIGSWTVQRTIISILPIEQYCRPDDDTRFNGDREQRWCVVKVGTHEPPYDNQMESEEDRVIVGF
jgi:hypothetical protein